MNFTIVTTFSTNPQINNILSFTCDGCGDGVGVASDMRGHSSGRHGGKRADGALSLACGEHLFQPAADLWVALFGFLVCL